MVSFIPPDQYRTNILCSLFSFRLSLNQVVYCSFDMFSSRLSGLYKSGLLAQNIRLLATATGYSKDHFDGMVKSATKVVVFMKGTPESPKCGFSNAVVQILKMHGVDKYDAYNVLEDENLRQGLL